MSQNTVPHEVQGRAIPWHELSPEDLHLAARVAHRAMLMLKAKMQESKIPLLPHQQLPEPRLLAMDVCVLKLSRPNVDLMRFATCGSDDFMDDIVTLMTAINRVDGTIPPMVNFRCAAVAR